MTKRIFRSIFLVATVMMLSVFAVVLGMLYDYVSSRQERELKAYAQFIGAGIEDNGEAYLEGLNDTEERITWVDRSGEVIYDSVADVEAMDNHKEREEVKLALLTGEGCSERYSATLAKKTVNFALRLDDGTVLRVSSEILTPVMLFLTMSQPLCVVLAAAILLSALLASKTSRKIIKPINEIDPEQPEMIEIYDELSPLIRKISVQNMQIRKQIQTLKQERVKFEAIISNMQEGILVLDKEGDVLSYNQGALLLLGADPPEKTENVYILNRSEGFRRTVEAVLSGRHWEENIVVGGRCCQLFANPVTEDEKVSGGIIILFDVTEKTKRDELRREFTANVSHELKTPLTSISGFAEIMKNGMVKNEDVSHFAGLIYDESRRLIQMVQDIIKISRLEENRDVDERTNIDMEQLIKENVERLRPVADKRNITIETDIENISFFGIRSVLGEIVFNLADNAIKYNVDKGRVLIILKKDKGNIVFSVKDTGIGIAPVDQDRIFERFYRVTESRSKETEGTGLGLAIVKHGAELHQGNIKVKSDVGMGCEIIVTLPVEAIENK